MRIKALTSDSTLQKVLTRKLHFGQSHKTCLLMQQAEEGSDVIFHRMPLSGFLGFPEKQLDSLKLCTVIAGSQINVDESSSAKLSMVAISSDALREMSAETLKVVKVASMVLTDERFSLKGFIEKVEPIIRQSPDLFALANIQFVLVPRGAYVDLESCLLSSGR